MVRSATTALAGTCVMIAALLGAPAVAGDNVPLSNDHWHSRPVTYRIHTSVPEDNGALQRTHTVLGASRWESYTKFWLTRGADVTGGINYNDRTTHIVFRSLTPPAWREGCPETTVPACTRGVIANFVELPSHLADDDTVMNSAFGWTTSDTWCRYTPHPQRVDVQTVMLHEFGHWGRLMHTADTNAVMFQSYMGCRRATTLHDRNSMFHNYDEANH